ncbi:hypothetical protein [Pseudophaeobacter flagellatus]|uniref:hypothetical protein n=1 Tax=Pseudophaeobacter flagellatus TaxID=2899119 RepID=UPI001E512DE1|nr:hypothetical protein [Pseudophaeobacter flagellatus]MCD9148133.1 hypothetical protein [Pseudophaeobacter flagellatus]
MPHAELKYSDDLKIDSAAILARIETIIQDHDASAGLCKGRAYPLAQYHHSHVAISVTLLVKAHRDSAFSNALLSQLNQEIGAMLPRPCEFSLGLQYSTPFYVTRRLTA